MEIWKDIPGWKRFYQVSSLGRIKGKNRKVTTGKYSRTLPERLLRLSVHKDGYLAVKLCANKRCKTYLVHRLVLLTFVGYSDLEVNHKNGIKDDNRLENLEYVTHKENMEHASNVIETMVRGENHPSSIMTRDDVEKAIRLYRTTKMTFVDIASFIGVSSQSVASAVTGRKWNHLKNHEVSMGSKGERNSKAVLTEDIVLEIRNLYSDKGYSYSSLASKYSVSKSCIEKIIKRKTWKHI